MHCVIYSHTFLTFVSFLVIWDIAIGFETAERCSSASLIFSSIVSYCWNDKTLHNFARTYVMYTTARVYKPFWRSFVCREESVRQLLGSDAALARRVICFQSAEHIRAISCDRLGQIFGGTFFSSHLDSLSLDSTSWNEARRSSPCVCSSRFCLIKFSTVSWFFDCC